VSKDSADTLGKFAARREIGMTLLSDPDSTMITAYGLRDDQYGTTGPYSAIARPTIVVVNSDGRIAYSQPVDHGAPPPVDAVLAALKGG
jgi:peroxiredoxin